MSYRPADLIEVSAWGRVVGATTLDPGTGYYAFEYDDDWIAGGIELSPLHLPLRRGVFVFPQLSRDSFYGLPAMLADALPDRFGNSLVDAWMAEQGFDPSHVSALDRLAYASNRAMGALTFAPPAGPSASEVTMVQLADLVAAARAQLTGSLDGDDIHRALAELIVVGSSAGGARAKAVLAYNPTTGQMLSGQFRAPEGYEQWLLKLDGVGDPDGPNADPLMNSHQYCRVEYAYYLMAIQAGVTMSPSQLLLEGPRAHFMTKRFDRGPQGERIHIETLCAMAHLDFLLARTHSYSSYFLTARELGLGADAAQEIFRRVVFNVMGVNRDDHTKNFSFLLSEGGSWQLAPAYDVTHANWGGFWTQTQQMSVNAKFIDITLDDLRTVGDRHEVPGYENVLKEVSDATRQWPDFARAAGIDGLTTKRIATDIEALRPR